MLCIAVIVDDVLAQKLLTAWTTYPAIPRWRRPSGKEPADVRVLWLWLWQSVWEELDLDDLAAACGATTAEIERKLRMLINARLIYPDGTISDKAEAVIRAKLAAVMGKRRPGRPRK